MEKNTIVMKKVIEEKMILFNPNLRKWGNRIAIRSTDEEENNMMKNGIEKTNYDYSTT